MNPSDTSLFPVDARAFPGDKGGNVEKYQFEQRWRKFVRCQESFEETCTFGHALSLQS